MVDFYQCWPPIVAHKITTLLDNQINKKYIYIYVKVSLQRTDSGDV